MSKVEEVKEYFKSKDRYVVNGYGMGCTDVAVDVFTDGSTYTIHLQKMYEGIGYLVSLKNLEGLSKILGTDRIDIGDEDYSSGCSTCDYGSSSTITLRCYGVAL